MLQNARIFDHINKKLQPEPGEEYAEDLDEKPIDTSHLFMIE